MARVRNRQMVPRVILDKRRKEKSISAKDREDYKKFKLINRSIESQSRIQAYLFNVQNPPGSTFLQKLRSIYESVTDFISFVKEHSKH